MKTEHKITIIQRYDSYFSGINNKGAFILALNTLIISGFLIGLKDLNEMVSHCLRDYFAALVGLTIFLSLISMALTILAIIPHLESSKKSIWFFNDVANRLKEEFLSELNDKNDREIESDIDEQIYFLAVGLKKKHRKVRSALFFNLLQMILLVLITYIILS